MPSFFSSAFSKGKKTSVEAAAIKAATLMIDQAKAKNSSGVVSDPAVYDAANKLLEPYSYDTGVLTKQAQLQAEKNSLTDRLNDQSIYAKNLKDTLTDNMFQIGKNNVGSPQAIVTKTANLYDLYSKRLNEEIDQRIANGKSFDNLIPLKDDIEAKAQSFASLSRQSVAGGNDGAADPQSFGYLAKTNPQTGKIMSFSIVPITDPSVTKGYYKTDSTYGSIPVYVNAFRDPKDNNNLTAKLGPATYKGEVSTSTPSDKPNGLNETVLKMTGEHGKWVTNLKTMFQHPFTGGDKLKKLETDAQTAASPVLDGKITSDLFDTTINLPKNSVGKDSSGTYYYMNNDGKLYQGSADTIAQYTGKAKDELDNDAYFLTKKDVDTVKTQQDPDQRGKSVLPPLTTPGSGQQLQPASGPQAPNNKSPQTNAGEGSPVAATGGPEVSGSMIQGGGAPSTPYAIKTKGGKDQQAETTAKIAAGQFKGKELAGGPENINPIA